MTDEDAATVGRALASMWRSKGLPDRMDLARLLLDAAEPWIAKSADQALARDLVWELSGVAYRFTETPFLLWSAEAA